jgi:predicted  nucleic acid-binding Zn-ribbon protein
MAPRKGDRPGGAKEPRKAERSLRKRLRRLEGQLASASQRESKRMDKLERARDRRQRLQAAVDVLRAEMTGAAPAAAAPRPAAVPKPPTRPTRAD